MALRPCLTCGRPSDGSRCPTHRRSHDRARGSTTERGYGWAHQQELATDPAYLAATTCGHCNEPFTDANPKAGGHLVPLRDHGGTEVVAHCRRCNSGWRATGL